MGEWLPYLGTFVAGGGLGGLAVYLIAPKADRERLKLDREKWEAEKRAHVRERRMKDLEALQKSLEDVLELRDFNARPFSPEVFGPDSREKVKSLMATTATVMSLEGTAVEDAVALLKAQQAALFWTRQMTNLERPEYPTQADDYPRAVSDALVIVRRLLDSI
ncbi:MULTISPECIES: hypothetical protein [unclassified Aeromicrobium]|uniref:hypothetical protein n=1 Tax=unclassified Aeromicrobium TaxID=2633570 RepID=UPI00396B44EF